MKSCPEGAFTLGHLIMAIFSDGVVGIVIAAVQREIEARRPKPPDPPPEG